MSAITKTMIEMALSHVDDPDLGQSLTQLGMIENIAIDGMKVSFDLVLTTPACPMKSKMKEDCINAIHEFVDRNAEVEVNLTSRKVEQPKPEEMFPNIKNTILVASGKGGVGKSTVAVNLAVALAKTGAKVGLIDADVYGPSIPIMFNITDHDIYGEQHNGKTYMTPILKYNVKLMSVGFLVDPDKAMVWRGPMASGALKQLLTETWWDEIDYLVVDMPPGTGDIHISLLQEVPMEGAVLVTTPQEVALADVEKGAAMFRNKNIDRPIFGLVENMAWFTPAEHPDEKYYIFGRDGGARMAESLGIELLGRIPLVQSIRESGDCGEPAALGTRPDAQAFLDLAGRLAEKLG